MTFFHLSSRRLSSSSTCSAWSDDHHHHGISPGAAPTNQTHHHHQSSNDNSKNSYHSAMATQVQHLLQDDGSGSRRQSSVSQRSCEGLTAGDCKDLWRCMLELQERYGCYHSTRIDIAVEAGDAGVSFMPNRFIIDTLNESVIDLLPEEGWTMLDQCLHQSDKASPEMH